MLYDEEEGCYYSPYKPLEFEPIQLYRETSPIYDNFDVNELPWLEMPSYIQEIANAERIPSGIVETSYAGPYKLPFMAIVVDGSYCRVIAGYNLIVGTRYETSYEKENDIPYRVSVISRKSEILANNAVCYTAVYKLNDYSLYENWRVVEPVSTGSNFNWYINFMYSDYRDFYFYGTNGIFQDRVTEVTKLNSSDTDMFPQFVIVNNPSSGFASGTITFRPDIWTGYIGTFSPPSANALQQATSKGIWETLKEIPENIASSFSDFFSALLINIRGFFLSLGDRISDFFTSLGDRISGFFDNLANKIKGFFLPSEGFFDTYVSDFQNYFKDRFGLLYELPDSVIGIMQQFIDYSPADSGYSITFPEVVMPVLDNGDWYDKVIIEETDIRFEFLEQGAFKTLYSMYRSVVWMIFIFALINLIIRKSERVFGGSG